MSRLKIFAAAVFLGVLGLSATSALAATYEGGNFKIAFLRVTQTYVYVSLDPAPVVCQGGSSWGEHLILYLDDPHTQEIYSALLSAYMSETRLSGLWFDDYTGICSTGNNVPRLRQIRFETK